MSAPSQTRTFWQRRFTDPLLALITQGITADKLAVTVAVGTAVSLFPFLGFTTVANVIAGLWLRLNQPLLQAINYVLTPVHLVMIFVYLRIGERIWGAEPTGVSLNEIVTTFKAVPFADFLVRFGWVGVYAFTAWLISAPVIIAGLYFSLRPLMRKLIGTSAVKHS